MKTFIKLFHLINVPSFFIRMYTISKLQYKKICFIFCNTFLILNFYDIKNLNDCFLLVVNGNYCEFNNLINIAINRIYNRTEIIPLLTSYTENKQITNLTRIFAPFTFYKSVVLPFQNFDIQF